MCACSNFSRCLNSNWWNGANVVSGAESGFALGEELFEGLSSGQGGSSGIPVNLSIPAFLQSRSSSGGGSRNCCCCCCRRC